MPESELDTLTHRNRLKKVNWPWADGNAQLERWPCIHQLPGGRDDPTTTLSHWYYIGVLVFDPWPMGPKIIFELYSFVGFHADEPGLVTRGWAKILAILSDFDSRLWGFGVLWFKVSRCQLLVRGRNLSRGMSDMQPSWKPRSPANSPPSDGRMAMRCCSAGRGCGPEAGGV